MTCEHKDKFVCARFASNPHPELKSIAVCQYCGTLTDLVEWKQTRPYDVEMIFTPIDPSKQGSSTRKTEAHT